MSSSSDKTDPPGTASFGFQEVPQDARQGLVNDVFAAVAGRYDLMNDLMSGGLHRLWKDDFVAMLGPPKSARRFELLDVAGGTGDIAFRHLHQAHVVNRNPNVRVTISDINPNMLAVGRQRAAATLPASQQAALSFLGLGIQPPDPSWGRMLYDGRGFVQDAWWLGFFPGLAIFLTVLAFNVVGDALRDVLDPRQLTSDEARRAS